MVNGWLLAGFSDEVTGSVVDLDLGSGPVLLVRGSDGVRAFDGTCPHRGARLAKGGRLDGTFIVCPFHGHRIRLGAAGAGDTALCVGERPAVEIGEMVFVHMGADTGAPDCGFGAAIKSLKDSHVFVHGFSMALPVSPTLVIENAFDTAHFGPVHNVPRADSLTVDPFDPDAGQPFTARGMFHVTAAPWDKQPTGTPISIPYEARAFGPGLIVSSQLSQNPYHFLVGATPDGKGGCIARVVVMVPKDPSGALPDMDAVEGLLGAMEGQLTADRVIWEGLPDNAPRRLQPGEEPIAAFWAFCRHFEPSTGQGAP